MPVAANRPIGNSPRARRKIRRRRGGGGGRFERFGATVALVKVVDLPLGRTQIAVKPCREAIECRMQAQGCRDRARVSAAIHNHGNRFEKSQDCCRYSRHARRAELAPDVACLSPTQSHAQHHRTLHHVRAACRAVGDILVGDPFRILVGITCCIAVLAAGFLLRLFMIQHDCGHGSFFRQRLANDWVGRVHRRADIDALRFLAADPRHPSCDFG